MGLQDDFILSALVPQNALPSDLLENALCGVAFGLGILGIITGVVFFICSQRRYSDGKSPGKVREPGIRAPVCVCVCVCQDSSVGLGARMQHAGLYPAIWGPCYIHSYWGAQKQLGAGDEVTCGPVGNMLGDDLRRRASTQLGELRGHFRKGEGPSGDFPSLCSLLRLILPKESLEQHRPGQQGCPSISCLPKVSLIGAEVPGIL